MPAPATAQLWAERTPEGFVMNVKAFRLFTGHQTEPHVLHKDLQLAMGGSLPPRFFYRDLPAELIDELWKRFRECLLPLQAAGRLGLVHFQFPPWVGGRRAGPGAGRALRAAHERLRSRRRVPPRHLVRRRGAAARDASPSCASSASPTPWSTARRASRTACRRSGRRRIRATRCVRLHGRNRGTWNVKGQTSASDRFNYDYPEDELRDMVPRIQQLALTAMQTHVIFNNNMEDQGQRNARSLTDLLIAAGVR